VNDVNSTGGSGEFILWEKFDWEDTMSKMHNNDFILLPHLLVDEEM
jgi:hypothetical protein